MTLNADEKFINTNLWEHMSLPIDDKTPTTTFLWPHFEPESLPNKFKPYFLCCNHEEVFTSLPSNRTYYFTTKEFTMNSQQKKNG